MKERLAMVLRKLEDSGWHGNAPLVVVLRDILEKGDPADIEEIFEAFR